MTDEAKNPLDQAVEHALDVFVYAPIGLLFDGKGVLPELIEKGKVQVNSARMFGQFAVQAGQSEATKKLGETGEQVRGLLASFGLAPSPAPEPAPAPKAKPAPAPAPEPAPEPVVEGPAVETLAIPDYDSLSASQVVSRLAGLAADELESVRRYEASKRGRKTILNKVAQLQK